VVAIARCLRICWSVITVFSPTPLYVVAFGSLVWLAWGVQLDGDEGGARRGIERISGEGHASSRGNKSARLVWDLYCPACTGIMGINGRAFIARARAGPWIWLMTRRAERHRGGRALCFVAIGGQRLPPRH